MFGLELVIGGAIFWFLVIALLVMCEISTVNESHWGFAWLVVFGVVLWFAFHANPFAWILNNFGAFMIYCGIYLGIGVMWGFAKWYFHLKNALDRIESQPDLRRDYDIRQASTNPFNGTFTAYLTDRGRIPVAKANKEKISVWMFWWPFSMFWTTLDDVLRRIYNAIIEQYLFLFDRISNAVFGHLNK